MDYKQQLLDLRNEYTKRRDAIHVETWHEEEPVEKDFAEQVAQSENDDVLHALDDDAKQIVIKIDNALLRIDADTFGQCLKCATKIPDKRLQLVPYAEYCIKCAEVAENQ